MSFTGAEALMLPDCSLRDVMLLNLHRALSTVKLPKDSLSTPIWTLRLYNDPDKDAKAKLMELLPGLPRFTPTTIISMLYRCETSQSA